MAGAQLVPCIATFLITLLLCVVLPKQLLTQLGATQSKLSTSSPQHVFSSAVTAANLESYEHRIAADSNYEIGSVVDQVETTGGAPQIPLESPSPKLAHSTAPVVVVPELPAPSPPPQAPSSLPSTKQATTRRRSCTGVVPLRGRWDVNVAPYFHPDADVCTSPPLLTPKSLMTCLERRGVYRPAQLFFSGNSFSRGEAYTLASWLKNSPEVPRLKQKTTCQKGVDGVHESCSLPITDKLTIKFMWRDSWYQNIGKRRDWCFQKDLHDCYSEFFGPDTDLGDVYVTNVARGYMEQFSALRITLNAESMDNIIADYEAFRTSGVYAGTTVWATSPEAHPHGAYGAYNKKTNYMNEYFAPRYKQHGLRVFDHAHFIRGKPENETWVDAIHPPTKSYLALMLHALGDLCEPLLL